MRYGFSLLSFAVGLAAGSIQAQVVIEGTVQLPKPSSDPGLNQRYTTTAEVAMAPTNPPAAVVYLEGDFRSKPGPPSSPPKSHKEQCVRARSAAHPGRETSLSNMDETYHNYSPTRAKRSTWAFRKDEKRPRPLRQARGSHHSLRIHERCVAILVLETPHFQKTDTAGRYRLENLPLGNYVLKAWVAGDDVRQRPVELKAGMTLHVDFPAK